MQNQDESARAWLRPVLVSGGVAFIWFAGLFAADYHLSADPSQPVWTLLVNASANDVRDAVGNLPEVVVAILGMVITVVSIILQLSATRYTPRVTEMFFRDRTNLLVMAYFVVTAAQCIWATVAIRREYVPLVLVGATIAMIFAAIFLLVPYFVYVFRFLEPERVVHRLERLALDNAVSVKRRTVPDSLRQQHLLGAIEQLADVAMNAISQRDRIIASRSLDALMDLAIGYQPHKKDLPDEWFSVSGQLARNPDFVVMASESVDEISTDRTWVEWKILRQYELIFNEAADNMTELCQLVAINTRYIGEVSLANGDTQTLALVIKFFNTYLRASINARNVRTSYNVFHQYRRLGEEVIRAGLNDVATCIADHFRYYAQLSSGAQLPFVTETAAYDLASLCMVAAQTELAAERDLLAVFLEIDRAPESKDEEKSLRGVRKAQAKLATFYLVEGRDEFARAIWADMEHEDPARLAGLREELLAVKDASFWEITDRGRNFDYLTDPQKVQLSVFFSWFGETQSTEGGVAADHGSPAAST